MDVLFFFHNTLPFILTFQKQDLISVYYSPFKTNYFSVTAHATSSNINAAITIILHLLHNQIRVVSVHVTDLKRQNGHPRIYCGVLKVTIQMQCAPQLDVKMNV